MGSFQATRVESYYKGQIFMACPKMMFGLEFLEKLRVAVDIALGKKKIGGTFVTI